MSKELYLYQSEDVSFDPEDYYLEEIEKDYKGFYPESHIIEALKRAGEIYRFKTILNERCAEDHEYLYLYFLAQHYRKDPRIKEVKRALERSVGRGGMKVHVS